MAENSCLVIKTLLKKLDSSAIETRDLCVVIIARLLNSVRYRIVSKRVACSDFGKQQYSVSRNRHPLYIFFFVKYWPIFTFGVIRLCYSYLLVFGAYDTKSDSSHNITLFWDLQFACLQPVPRMCITVAVMVKTAARWWQDLNLSSLTLQLALLPLAHCNLLVHIIFFFCLYFFIIYFCGKWLPF